MSVKNKTKGTSPALQQPASEDTQGTQKHHFETCCKEDTAKGAQGPCDTTWNSVGPELKIASIVFAVTCLMQTPVRPEVPLHFLGELLGSCTFLN